MHQVMPGPASLLQHTWIVTKGCSITPEHAIGNSCRLRTTRSANVRGRCRRVVTSALTPQTVFNVVTLAVMPLYGLMVAFPRKPLTKAVVSSPVFYAAGSLLYLAALVLWGREGLLGAIWGACREYFADGQVGHIATLFEYPRITALAWTHLLLLDLFVARHIYLDGLKKQVTTAHSVVLCFMFGPTGLLSHMLTKWLSSASKRSTTGAQHKLGI